MVSVRNATRGVLLGAEIIVAGDSRTRRTGLLKHKRLDPGQGLWIVPCEAVHTFGMTFPIDVLFLSRSKKILKIRPGMMRRKIAICLRAHSVLELPAGTLQQTGTLPGDQLEFESHPIHFQA